MPELAEVEVIVRGLRPQLAGQTIVAIPWLKPHLENDFTHSQLTQKLVGLRITSVDRLGKYILIGLSNGKHLVIHLRMTGKLLVKTKDSLPTKHVSFIFELTDKALFFDDIRKFGSLVLTDNPEELPCLTKLGPDALTITVKQLQAACLSKKPIKTLLLDQEKIAGLGNIYVCEILFLAQVHPLAMASRLMERQVQAIHRHIGPVLKKSIKAGGTSISDYVNSSNVPGAFQKLLQVYQRSGQPCPVCVTPIERLKISGRSTFLCPKCQKAEVSSPKGHK